MGLGSGKSFFIRSQWLHEIFLPGSREAAVPKAFVKRSVGLCLNALPGVSLEKPVLAMRITEFHLPSEAVEGFPLP